jgi:ATP-binding protein involved in chromosome partitioning
LEADVIRVQEISQKNDRTLQVLWTDQRHQEFDVVELRRKCPCAVCIDEWTREKRLKPEDVSEEVRPIEIESVGRYALKIRFTDGHGTGIYTFENLRQMN